MKRPHGLIGGLAIFFGIATVGVGGFLMADTYHQQQVSLEEAYKGVPLEQWNPADRQVYAHVIGLQRDGKVAGSGTIGLGAGAGWTAFWVINLLFKIYDIVRGN